jgi:5-methylcytosine-specific restriction endonuclease McrA
MKKMCTKCFQLKPADADHFGHTPSGNLRGSCRECMRRYVAEYERRNPGRETKRGNSAKSLFGYLMPGLLKDQGYRCVYCKSSLTVHTAQLDHITPTSRGGADSSKNLQALCVQCNQDKHKKTHEEHLAWRAKVAHTLPLGR